VRRCPPPLAILAVLGFAPGIDVETLRSVRSLPAHIAGRFTELSICQLAADGTWFIFDRRSHAVFSVAPSADAAREIIQVGAEPGRILRPQAFDLADDDTFVVADAPGSRGRVQVFFATGASLGGFTLPGREVPLVVMDGVVISGVGSLVYTGKSVLISQPETGRLITEYALDGRTIRTFGDLRPTGHEQDRDLHIALNAGLVVVNPEGGVYFVFAAGAPQFRKYDTSGQLQFERHIEGVELDDYMKQRPTVWPRRKTADGEIPVVRPAVRAAAAEANGNLWVSLDVPYTYVYDRRGDKQRVIQFRAAGIIAPTSLKFTSNGRIVATPGCFVFEKVASR
jgi:hypothetical protein